MTLAKKFDVLGLGAVAVDDFIYVEAYPPPDEKARVISRRRDCGGLTAIALIAATRLGARCAYVGALGTDELSRFALECLKREKIDVSKVKLTPSGRPVHSNIVLDPRRGTRNIFYDLNQVVGGNVAAPAALIESCRVLFVDNIGVRGMIRAARFARRASIPVVADFDTDTDPRFPELLPLADHLIISRGFAGQLTGKASPEKSVRALAAPDRAVAVVTCGEEGCWYLARGWKAPKHQRAFKVATVDSTGCGDVFHGAYAFALARDLPLEERIRLASAAAALKAKSDSGPAGIPSLPEVRRFLNSTNSRSANSRSRLLVRR
jgi:sulfofructose kinase